MKEYSGTSSSSFSDEEQMEMNLSESDYQEEDEHMSEGEIDYGENISVFDGESDPDCA